MIKTENGTILALNSELVAVRQKNKEDAYPYNMHPEHLKTVSRIDFLAALCNEDERFYRWDDGGWNSDVEIQMPFQGLEYKNVPWGIICFIRKPGDLLIHNTHPNESVFVYFRSMWTDNFQMVKYENYEVYHDTCLSKFSGNWNLVLPGSK